MRKYYSNDILWCEEPTNENGKIHGMVKVYYTNGQLMYKKEYRDGQLHGVSQHWELDGELKWKAFFLYDVLIEEEEYRKHELIEKLAGMG